MITKYLVSIVGEEYSQYLISDAATKKRIKLFAKLIHIPMILWFVLGYFLTQQLFYDVSIGMAVFSGLVCSLFIYLIDLAILNFPKNIWATLFRVALGFVFAALGALLADVFIFEKDINEYLKDNKQAEIQTLSNSKISQLGKVTSKSKVDWLSAQKQSSCEADGSCGSNKSKQKKLQLLQTEKMDERKHFSSKRAENNLRYKQATKLCGLFCSQAEIDKKYENSLNKIDNNEINAINKIEQKIEVVNRSGGSGQKGTGKIYKAKQKHADELKTKYEENTANLERLRLSEKESISNIYFDIDQNSGLINRIKILHKIVWEKGISIIFSIMFFTVFLIFELVLILFKLLGRETVSDRLAAHHERIAIAKIRIAEIELGQFEEARKLGYQGPLTTEGLPQ